MCLYNNVVHNRIAHSNNRYVFDCVISEDKTGEWCDYLQ